MKPRVTSLMLMVGIGWFLGVASGLFFFKHFRPEVGRHDPRKRERFYKELRLTPDQRTQVDVIIAKKHARLDEIFSAMDPRIEEVRRSTHDEIRKLLTPEQQAEFDKREAHKAHFRDRYERHLPPEH